MLNAMETTLPTKEVSNVPSDESFDYYHFEESNSDASSAYDSYA
jgi:hypothetical protein